MSTTVVTCSFCEKEVKQEEIDIHRHNCDRGIGNHEEKCSAKVDENETKSSFPKETSHGVDNDHPCPSCVQTVGKSHIEKEASVVHCDSFSMEVEKSDLREKRVLLEDQCVFGDENLLELEHYDLCKFILVCCVNGCGKKLPRKDLCEHIESECIETVIECKYCKIEVKKKWLDDHQSECLKFPTACPESCDVEVAREDMERHLDEECPKRVAAYAYKEMQCSYEGFPAGMGQHVKEEMQQHLELTKNAVHKLHNHLEVTTDAVDKLHIVVKSIQEKLESERIRNEELQREIKELRLMTFLWKVEDIGEEIERSMNECSQFIYSPPFYSSKHGYKLRLKMIPYHYYHERKSHLAVYIQVMSGEYDSILKWPFTKLVTIRLVDQATDGKDIVYSVPVDNRCFIKPKEGEDNKALMLAHVSHEVLNSGSYIVDDAIFLKVTVE